MLFIDHYKGDTGYHLWEHLTFDIPSCCICSIWSPMSHESEVPAYIKKRQVPFFGLGRIMAMLGAVVLTCSLLCSLWVGDWGRPAWGLVSRFLRCSILNQRVNIEYFGMPNLKLYSKLSTIRTKRMDYGYNKHALIHSSINEIKWVWWNHLLFFDSTSTPVPYSYILLSHDNMTILWHIIHMYHIDSYCHYNK